MVRFFSLLISSLVVILLLTAGCTFLQNSPAAGTAPARETTMVPTQGSSPGASTATVLPVPDATTASGTCPPDIQNDPANCGGCGNSCPANAICQAGQCYCREGYAASNNQCIAAAPTVTVAGNNSPAGMSPCPDGYCYELSSSPANCGMCGNICPAGLTCSASVCTATTPEGTTAVTTAVTTSVTTTTTTTVSPHGTLVKPGFTLAGQLVVNCAVLGKTSCGGVCVNTSTDTVNCGSCGNVCASPTTGCCNGDCVNFQTDPGNCGTCGHTCGALSTCIAGSCTVKTVVTVPVTIVKPVTKIPVYQPIYQPAGP